MWALLERGIAAISLEFVHGAKLRNNPGTASSKNSASSNYPARYPFFVLPLAAFCLFQCVGCGGGAATQSASSPTQNAASITISPNKTTVKAGTSQTFAATVSGTANQAVTWSVGSETPAAGVVAATTSAVGSINAGGLYVAPSNITVTTTVQIVASSVAYPSVSAATPVTIIPAFNLIANFQGIGGLVASTVGPGPTSGSQWFYASYLYYRSTLDVVAIDPDTGNSEVFHSPILGEEGARNIAVGPDGSLYMGTVEHAHFLKLDPKQKTFIDLGRPSTTETYIWDVAFGSDNRLYGVTYPNCKLVRYDPATGQSEDLGRMDPIQQYAHYVVGSKDGFIYVGIGGSETNIAAYQISTGQQKEILPLDAQSVGFATVYLGTDGNTYGTVGSRVFSLNQWVATELKSGQTVSHVSKNTLADGRTLSLAENQGTLTLSATNPTLKTTVQHTVAYKGENVGLFRIGFGPDGLLYGSTALPAYFLQMDLTQSAFKEIGSLGGGELYSFLSHDNSLLIGAYSGLSMLMSYQPGTTFAPAANSGNPQLLSFNGGDASWRMEALINGPDGNVYGGAVAGYGLLESPLVQWNTATSSVALYDIAVDQSVVSLTSWNNLIIGGTSIEGGGGSFPTQASAELFLWNPATGEKGLEIIPVPGAVSVTDLITAPNNIVYGIAGNMLFEFNPATGMITGTQTLPFSNNPIYNSVALDSSGNIWGLAPNGIFTIDTKTNVVKMIASPMPINGGFAMSDGVVYFTSGSSVYSYTI
jgi:streptogramin lyase